MRFKMKYLIAIVALFFIAETAANDYKPTTPDMGTAMQNCPASEGTVRDVFNVTLDKDLTTIRNTAAVIGGYIGNRATKDKGDAEEVIGTLFGAGVGAAIGNNSGKKLDKDGVLLIIDVIDPRKGKTTIKLTQGKDNLKFEADDQVWVIGNLRNNPYNRKDPCNSVSVMPRST